MSEHTHDIAFHKFISSNNDVLKYLHNTSDEEIAISIMQNGFRFESRLDYTTDMVSGNDVVQIEYFKLIRKKYGKFTMVIHIGKNIVDKYNLLLKNTVFFFYEVISTLESELSQDGESVFVLNPQFVKGYYIHEKKIGIINPLYNPNNDLPEFEQNLQRLLSK
ncbi:MAG: hypothetical protein A2046_14040 [Bacteroidetes bacterium GWA2_30_7]|nr:MAG: hypothetical protein A2046_14040 [Bacteroidetes bacterium GWA2_30_7]